MVVMFALLAVMMVFMMVLMVRVRGMVKFDMIPVMHPVVIVNDHRCQSAAPSRINREAQYQANTQDYRAERPRMVRSLW